MDAPDKKHCSDVEVANKRDLNATEAPQSGGAFEFYFRPRPWELGVYKKLGVKHTRKLVLGVTNLVIFPFVKLHQVAVNKVAGDTKTYDDAKKELLKEGALSSHMTSTNIQCMKKHEKDSRWQEAGKLAIFAACAKFLTGYLSNVPHEEWDYLFLAQLFGLMFINFQLLILQRSNRARIYSILEKKGKRQRGLAVEEEINVDKELPADLDS